jgi:hypothetical protein
MILTTRLLVRTAMLALASALTACADTRSDIAGIPSGAADGLYPQLLVSGASASTTEVSLSLLRKPTGVRLGSYQGELTYDPSVLRFEGATLPEGVDGAASAITPGHVRFVGSALDGLGASPLLTLRFSRTGAVTAASFGTAFEEVTDAADLTDLTASVQGGAPLITIR